LERLNQLPLETREIALVEQKAQLSVAEGPRDAATLRVFEVNYSYSTCRGHAVCQIWSS